MDDALERHIASIPNVLMHFFWGLRVLQRQPEVRSHDARLRLRASDVDSAHALLATQDERTQRFIKLVAEETSHHLVLSSSGLYNPYRTYVVCLRNLAPFLEDAVFFIWFGDEDDQANLFVVADRYQIRSGELSAERRQSATVSDLRNFDQSLKSLFPE
jgi:hypothetical protein